MTLTCGAPTNIGLGKACYVYPNNPATPGLVTPDVVFDRGIYMNGVMTMDDGKQVTMWGFTDSSGGGGGGGGGGMGGGGGGPGGNMGNGNQFPSPAMRVTENQIVHTQLTVPQMMVHTIHHHGIEPAWYDDGVGHISWDVKGTYTYQWRPWSPGTYFYHCHVNTPLHAEMGMYGALIVDPAPDPNDPPGTKRAFAGGPIYDVEAFWVADEIDSSWRGLPWWAGTCGGDVGLNDLNPDYFVITGYDGAQSALTAPGVAANMSVGQTLLARYINAGFYPQHVTFGGLAPTVVAADGRPLPNPHTVTSLDTVAAERYDLIFQPTETGTYEIKFYIQDWVTMKTLGVATTLVTVT